MVELEPTRPLSPELVAAISQAITKFLNAKAEQLANIGPELAPMLDMAREFTAGGKRFRPAMVVWGYRAVDSQAPIDEPILRAAASLDLLHVSALVHDDLMDGSETRRGIPAAHRQFEQLHRSLKGRGSSESFGQAGSILLGDLLLMWCQEMLSTSGMPQSSLSHATAYIDAMRTEVTAGQYLDMAAEVLHDIESTSLAIDRADRVVEYKTARYTIQRPVQFGAALAGASDEQIEALARYGAAIGKAFQYRDDILGVIGDPAHTGKPIGDDIREGKRTLLIAYALHNSAPAERARLDGVLANPEVTDLEVVEAQQIAVKAGAIEDVERHINAELKTGLSALEDAPFTEAGRAALQNLAQAAAHRTF